MSYSDISELANTAKKHLSDEKSVSDGQIGQIWVKRAGLVYGVPTVDGERNFFYVIFWFVCVGKHDQTSS